MNLYKNLHIHSMFIQMYASTARQPVAPWEIMLYLTMTLVWSIVFLLACVQTHSCSQQTHILSDVWSTDVSLLLALRKRGELRERGHERTEGERQTERRALKLPRCANESVRLAY